MARRVKLYRVRSRMANPRAARGSRHAADKAVDTRRRGGLHPGAQQAVKGHAAIQGLDGQAVEGAQHQVGPGKIAFPLAQKR